MIIFDLDGTLANCEHRRYFIDRERDHPDYFRNPCEVCKDGSHHKIDLQFHKITGEKWKPDWDAFYEACDRDEPIKQTIQLFNYLYLWDNDLQIWSGRSMRVQEKTVAWFSKHLFPYMKGGNNPELDFQYKMRPIGNTEPDEVLKGRWLDEALASGKTIEYCFDDRPKMVHFWRSRGVFCFDVNQTGEEF